MRISISYPVFLKTYVENLGLAQKNVNDWRLPVLLILGTFIIVSLGIVFNC